MARPKGSNMSIKYARCPECGTTYPYKVLRDARCCACKKKAYNAARTEERQVRSCKKHNKSSLELVVEEIASYNKAHGTNYTYGKYMGKFGVGGG